MKAGPSPELVRVLERCRPAKPTPPNILHTLLAVQESLGSVPYRAIPDIARALEVTEADVAGVLSFYPDLRARLAGRHLIRVCMGESCVANHSERVLAALRHALQVGVDDTTPDGNYTLERVYCVGNCAVSPSVMVDEDVHGRITPTEVGELLKEYRSP